MAKKAKVFLELSFEYEDPVSGTLEWVRSDLENEIGCCCNKYDIEKCEVVHEGHTVEIDGKQILRIMNERALN